jgi:hypothetical protein
MQRPKEEVPCPTPGCWQFVKTGGYCGACYSAMRRLAGKTLGEIETYLTRVGRFASRGKVAISGMRAASKKRRAA